MNTRSGKPGTGLRARRSSGFSLVELMVALVIGLFLMVGVIQLLIGSKQSYRFHDALSRLQENGRFALETMTRDIRMAGYRGCVSPEVPINNALNTPTAYLWNFDQPIQGFESTAAGAWTPALDASFTSPLAATNVDAITIRGADGLAGQAVLAQGSGTANLQVPVGSFAACDIAVAANCQQATVFQVTGVAGGNLAHAAGGCAPGNATNDLGQDYVGGEVAPMSTKNYYIRTGESGAPALWRRMNAAPAQELVEGVERMEIRYGVCQGTELSKRRVNPPYVNANAVANWADVCSVRIDLLLVSLSDRLRTTEQGQTHTIIFPADTGTQIVIPAGDRRLRQAFSATVGIRNRLP